MTIKKYSKRVISLLFGVLAIAGCGSAPSTAAHDTSTPSALTQTTVLAPTQGTSSTAVPVPMATTTSAAPARSSSSAQPTAKPSLVPAVIATIDVKGASWGIAAHDQAVWVQVDPPVDAMVRIDTRTAAVTARVAHGRNAASGEAALWIAAGDHVLQVDPATGETLATIPTEEASYLGVGLGAVWTMTPTGLIRIDVATRTITATIPIPDCDKPANISVGHDSVWMACNRSSSVARIDAKHNTVAAMIPVGPRPHGVAVSEDAVWVPNGGDNTVSRIDPATNTVIATIENAGGGGGIVVGDDAVWAATVNGIAKIDPRTNTIVGQIELGSGSYYGLVLAAESLWVSTRSKQVYRLNPQAATEVTNATTPTR